jgi:Tol biopolymer transport system component
MDATQPTQRRFAAGTSTIALAVLLLLCASAVVTACGGTSTTTSTSPSVAPTLVAASMAASPSATPLPKAAGSGTIAFTKVTEDSTIPPFDIYAVRSDGTGLRRLAANARGPAWSPDGSQIAYTSFSARGGVWVMNADGSGQRRVTPAPGGADWVAWSPDGRQILFSSTAFSGAATLVVVNADGSGLKSVFTRSFGDTGYTPAWAPDGRILFGRRTRNLGEICSVDPGGRGLTVVTPTQIPANFSLSADGKWLAIYDGDSDSLVRMAASGRGLPLVLVEEVSQYQRGPALSSWSPNGSKLVLGNDSRAWLLDRSVLYVAKADGSEVWEVPNTDDAYDPAWRPE